MFTFGDATPELIDYAGGGSAKEWTSTLDSALQLDFDNVVPGHGVVTTKAEMRKYRDSTLRLRNRVHELVVQKKSRDDIAKVMRDRVPLGRSARRCSASTARWPRCSKQTSRSRLSRDVA